jgi:hypothetical protein
VDFNLKEMSVEPFRIEEKMAEDPGAGLPDLDALVMSIDEWLFKKGKHGEGRKPADRPGPDAVRRPRNLEGRPERVVFRLQAV